MSPNTQIFLSIGYSIILGWVAASTAENRGKKPSLWFMIGFFFGIFGIAYLLFITRKSATVKEKVPVIDPVIEPLPSYDYFLKEWFFLDDKHQQQGPVGFQYLKGKITEDAINPLTYVWTEGMAEWKRINDIPGFTNAIQDGK